MSDRRQTNKMRSEYGAATVLVLIALLLLMLAGMASEGARPMGGGASAHVIATDGLATEGGRSSAAGFGSTSLTPAVIKAGSAKTATLQVGGASLHKASDDESDEVLVASNEGVDSDQSESQKDEDTKETPAQDTEEPSAPSSDEQSSQSGQGEQGDDQSDTSNQPSQTDQTSQSEQPKDSQPAQDQSKQDKTSEGSDSGKKADTQKTDDTAKQQGEKSLEKKISCVNGTSYTVKLTYDEKANIPDNAELKLVELNQNLTKKQKEDKANKNRPYDTERFVSKNALTKRGEVLDRWLKLTDNDYRYFTKYMDIMLVADGQAVVPDAPVEVTIETKAVPRDQAGTLEIALKVDADKPTKKNPYAYELLGGTNETDKKDPVSKVSFTTEKFGEFAVVGVAYSMGTWDLDGMKINVMGPRNLKSANMPGISVDTGDEGLQLRQAFNVKVSPSPEYGTTLWISAKSGANAKDQSREGGLCGYRVWKGQLADRMFGPEGTKKPIEFTCDDEGVALVWDTGYRHQSLAVRKVGLDGLLPEGVSAKAKYVQESYNNHASISKKLTKEAEAKGATLNTVAAYDISMAADGKAYQPSEEHPVTVSISSIYINDDGLYQVWHVRDNGSVELVEDATFEGDTVTFEATDLNVFMVVETTIETTLETDDGKTYRVQVTYDNTTGIPEDAELEVSEIKEGQKGYKAYVEKTAQALDVDVDDLVFARAFDITLKDPATGREYQPNKDVRVSIELLSEKINSRNKLGVVHIPGDSKAGAELMDARFNGQAVEFATDGFSVYVVTEAENPHLCTYTFYSYNETGSRAEYMFESSEGDVTSSVTLKNGEKLTAPQNPVNPSNPDATFVGWYPAVEGSALAPDGTPELESEPFDFDAPQSITDDTTEAASVRLYAKFTEVLYVNFHGYDTDGQISSSPVVQTVMLTRPASQTINLNDYTAAYNDTTVNDAFQQYQFYGWSEELREPGTVHEDDMVIGETDYDNYSVTTDIDLYPVFVAIRWLIPVSGNVGTSATYFPPFSFQTLSGPTSLEAYVPTRPGYVFHGWYLDVEDINMDSQNGTGMQLTDSDGNFVEDFDNDAAEVYGVRLDTDGSQRRLLLSTSVNIYAKWAVQDQPVNYTIAVWRQLPTESSSTEDKSYMLEDSFTLSGTADSLVSVSDEYTQLNDDETYAAIDEHQDSPNPYADYVFNSTKSELGPKSVKPKGNRVFNLYYDRADTAASVDPQATYSLTLVEDDGTAGEPQSLVPGSPLAENVPQTHVVPESRPSYISTEDSYWPDGYGFYWYADSARSTRVFFASGAEYDNYDDSKVLYETMPNHNLTLYGQWHIRRFRVNIDTDYGALATESNGVVTGIGSTWFNVEYGERIIEYTHLTRDYVPSKSGEYYFVKHDNASDVDRYTYYTKDVTKATELTTFKQAPGTFIGEGWSKVNEDGSEVPYEFADPVTQDTTLRMHWKLAGTYYLEYNAETVFNGKTMKGTFLNGDEATRTEGYSDRSVIFLTGAANPPESYEFVGWRVRGDESGKIYRPGTYFTLPAEYAVTVNGMQKVFLDAVYSQVVRAKILYDANGGTIDTKTVDYGAPTSPDAPAPNKAVSDDGLVATISNLVSNSEVRLSSGAGFSCTDSTTGQPLELAGWYQVAEDGTREDFSLGQTVHVDTSEPIRLYASWNVAVRFDKNDEAAQWDGSWEGYADEGDQKVIEANLNELLAEPVDTVTKEVQSFDFWSTESGETATAFDFASTKITGSMTLYAHYTSAKKVPFRVLEQTGVQTNLSYREKGEWQESTSFEIQPEQSIEIPPADIDAYATIPSDYHYVCAYVATDIQSAINDADKVTALKYADGSLKVTKDGVDVDLNDDEQVFLVYAPNEPLNIASLHIAYVKEGAGGQLTLIEGASIEGVPAITYNGAELTLNGSKVMQNQPITFSIGDTFTISQDASASAFHMPPLLDDGAERLDLTYDRIGVGGQRTTVLGGFDIFENISDLNDNVSNKLELQLKIDDNQLKWSFDGSEWHAYTEDEPTIYVIYQERGFELTLVKSVTKPSSETGIDSNKTFTVTIESDSIVKDSYEAEGTGYNSVSATPARDGNAGHITLAVKDGSNIIVRGLGKGSYTVTESLPDDSFEMRATVDGTQEPELNPVVALEFEKDTTVTLNNEPQVICQVPNGDLNPVQFYTLNSALAYIGDTEFSDTPTIQMLVDYVMPSTDTLVIPEGYDIRLTSSAGTKTITRGETLSDDPLFTNRGTLTLGNITIDGAADSSVTAPNTSAPLIRNSGTLTVGQGATLQNSYSSKDGGAIYSTGDLNLYGSLTGNRSEKRGGAVYAAGGNMTLTGTFSGNSAADGGAIYYGGSSNINITAGTLSGNSATSGNGGALYAVGGTIDVSGANIGGSEALGNTAPNGNGGGIYLENAVLNLQSDASVSGNSAENGGGIYAEAGELTLAGIITGNTATEGNGGGVYLERGELTMTAGSMTKNTANNGNGGAIYTDAGIVMLFGGVIGNTSNDYDDTSKRDSNYAQNGSAVFVNTGSASFAGTIKIKNNQISEGTPAANMGGAVGVGNQSARLYFTGTPVIQNNNQRAKESGSGNDYCNVYLNQDSDLIINATNLASGFWIGVYVPGDFEDDDSLFTKHGTVCARYGTYETLTKDTVKNNLKNDRLSEVQTGLDATTNKVYWYASFQVEVKTLDNYTTSLPPTNAGTNVALSNKWYDPPASKNYISAIAEDIVEKKQLSLGDRTFDSAFVKLTSGSTYGTYDDYVKELNWDNSLQKWIAVKRDGTKTPLESAARDVKLDYLRLYYANPAYLSIENNSQYPLTINTLTIGSNNRNAINTSSQTGFGYVVSIDGETQEALKPIETASFPTGKNVSVVDGKLVLSAGGAIKLVFPGARGQAFNLQGSFSKTDEQEWESVSYTLTGVTQAQTWPGGTTPNYSDPFAVQKNLLNNSSSYEIIIGGRRPICKIVTNSEITEAAESEYSRLDPHEGTYEYLFTTLTLAKSFAIKYQNKDATTIQMLTDYLISASDKIDIGAEGSGCDLTITTAVTGKNQYPRLSGNATEQQQSERRATLSRDVGYLQPLIKFEVSNNEAQNNLVNGTTLTIRQLNFDGRNLGGSNEYGIIRTKNVGVTVRDATFENCKAKSGGGIAIDFSEKYSDNTAINYDDTIVDADGFTEYENYCRKHGLHVDNARFLRCASTTGTRVGGGAIWTCAKALKLKNSYFESCTASDQGGAVFHRIDAKKVGQGKSALFTYALASKSIVSDCDFISCQASAAGGYEADTCYIKMTGCTFRNCQGSTRNGGGVNIYIYEESGDDVNITGAPTDSGTTEAWFESCVFENCSAGNRGGGLRSLCQITKVWDCTFKNCSAKNEGGALLLANKYSVQLEVLGCTIDGCKTTNASKQGGGVYSNALELIVGDYEYVDGKQPIDETIGIYNQDKTKRSTEIKNCISTGEGGGVSSARGDNASTATFTNVTISGNKTTGSGKSGGGVYSKTKTVSFTGCTIQNNIATNNGGGICEDVDSKDYSLTIDSTKISGNTANSYGGGVYTKTQLTLRNNTQITENRLNSTTKDNAAGVYLPNQRTLTVGDASKASLPDYTDNTSVKDNVLSSAAPSNLRLWWNTADATGEPKNQNNGSSVKVLCNLGGEIRVINAAVKGKKFGVAEGTYTGFKDTGFKELDHTFIADDGSLYGVFDRMDENPDDGHNIIWRGDVICKITDRNGNLLYLDAECNEPAIFDRLDYAKTKDDLANGSKVSAFSFLRQDDPELYSAKNTRFYLNQTGNGADNTCCVKLLIDTVATSDQNTLGASLNTTGAYPDRTIILTTAGSTDADYRYTGAAGTYCVIKGLTGKSTVDAKVNLVLRNIILDGGSAQKSRGIVSEPSTPVTITLEKNAVLRNFVRNDDNGGGVYLVNSSLTINGGSIYNCSAKNGGGVYHKASGEVRLLAGTISSCKATDSTNGFGGGVCTYGSSSGFVFTMSGGLINNCTANKGGGVYVYQNTIMDMSGGSITANSANQNGGGIAVDTGKWAELYFSGQVTVSGNKLNGNTCNVQLDRDSNQIIYSYSYNAEGRKGLKRGSTIGVYVPGDANSSSSLFAKHGALGTPFGTYKEAGYEGSSTYLYCFVNDRMGYKGGLMPNPDPDKKDCIFWVEIYSLQISKQVLSDNPAEMSNDQFTFEVTFYTQSGGNLTEVTTDYDLIWETGGSSTEDRPQTVRSGETLTLKNEESVVVDNLPEKVGGRDLHYRVRELTTGDMYDSGGRLKYVTTTFNSSGTSSPYVVEGIIGKDTNSSTSSKYLSVAAFTNQKAICKLTYDGNLLYYENEAGRYIPAVYSELYRAFNQLNGTSQTKPLRYKDPFVGTWKNYTAADSCNIEMLIPEYSMNTNCEMSAGKIAVLTTAQHNATDGYPYSGPYDGEKETPAQILRGNSSNTKNSMFRVSGDLTLTDIVLDGNRKSTEAYGGIVNLRPNLGSMTIQDGAALRNANNAQDGGAVYVNEGTTLTITGGEIKDNVVTGNKNGAGIYVKQGGVVRLQGNPDFGGPGVYTATDAPEGKQVGDIRTDVGNFAGNISGAQNGGKAYTKQRQDIYLEGKAASGQSLAALVVTDELTSGDGSIWVWAAQSPHYKTLEQFALLDDSLFITVSGQQTLDTSKLSEADLATTLKVFRDARPDAETGASAFGRYLDGMMRVSDSTGKNIYWYGIEGSSRVVLRKVTESGSSYNALSEATFVIYANAETTLVANDKDGNPLGSEEKPLVSGDNGVFFAGELNYGTYYVKELSPQSGRIFIVYVGDEGVGYAYPDPNDSTKTRVTRKVEAEGTN